MTVGRIPFVRLPTITRKRKRYVIIIVMSFATFVNKNLVPNLAPIFICRSMCKTCDSKLVSNSLSEVANVAR